LCALATYSSFQYSFIHLESGDMAHMKKQKRRVKAQKAQMKHRNTKQALLTQAIRGVESILVHFPASNAQ